MPQSSQTEINQCTLISFAFVAHGIFVFLKPYEHTSLYKFALKAPLGCGDVVSVFRLLPTETPWSGDSGVPVL